MLAVICAILLCLFHTQARSQTVDWRNDFTTINMDWTGSGDLTGSSSACIRSRTNRPRRPVNYGIMVLQDFSGDFIASNGSHDMVLDLSYQGVGLTDGGFTGAVFPGSTNCSPVTMDVRVSATQLENLPQGTYTTSGYGTHNRLIVCATTDNSGVNCLDPPQEPYEDSRLDITINIPAYTRLFNVGDFNLPPYDGVSPTLTQDMLFCVKSTSSSAGYRLTATSDTHHTGSGDFAVSKDSLGVETIPYTLFFSASTDPSAGAALVSGVPTGPYTGSHQNQCGGGNNASMRVAFSGADIKPAPPGDYSGIITIRVEPN